MHATTSHSAGHSAGPRMSARVSALISTMTTREKVQQLQIVFRPNADDALDLARTGIGATFWPRSAAAVNALQRAAVAESRLGIPLLVGLDVIHGQRTIAPVPIAQAAMFDPRAVESLAALAAREARSGGVTWTFSPMADISYDPRWGRVVEGFGEDAHLAAELTRAMIHGYQGDDLGAPTSLAAAAKHFVGYGMAEGGRDYNTADVSEHRLRNVLLEPFRAAVDAECATVMAAFNTVDGRPMHAHRALLTGVLKQEWGFDGVVVGDADGVRNLVPHGIAADVPDAVRLAYQAGLDMEMGGAPAELTDEQLATIDPDRLDDAVARVLALKERLGLFERPYTDESAEITSTDDEARALTRSAAGRSSVVLRNDGILPLRAGSRVLLTGPFAASTDLLGAWTQSFGTPAASVANAFEPRADVTVVDGVSALGASDDAAAIASAVAAAASVDVVVAVVGEPSSLSGEAASRSDLRLPGNQEQLIRALADTGTPVVVVLVAGRPLVVGDWIDSAAATVIAWHGGTAAAEAIIDVLLGDVDPAGRLPMGMPRSVGQIPIPYAHENTGRPATTGGSLDEQSIDVGLHGPDNVAEKYTSKYLDAELGPLFPFGHGGGYASFTYGAPSVSSSLLTTSQVQRDGVTVTVDVTNTSSRDGEEVAQVYLSDPVASVAQPVRRLVAFERRAVAARSTATFTFSIPADAFAFWSVDTRTRVLEPGAFVLHVGGDSVHTQSVDLTVR